jgi:hypothetical protein
MPGQQIVDPVDRVVGDAGEDVAQVRLRIEAVQGRGLDERVENRGPTTAGVRAGKEVILTAQRDRAAILPMSGRRSRCTIAGTPSMGVVSGASAASSV